MDRTTFTYDVEDGIAHIRLNRPAAFNTMNGAFWAEFPAAFDEIAADMRVRAVLISSTGRHFSAGLDLKWAAESQGRAHADPGRARESFRRHVKDMQQCFEAIDQCRVPVIAAIQGGCIGGGLDLVSACDLRVGTADCFFTIQEVNVGIVADVGTLQRLPYLLPQGLVRELAYTGRRWAAKEALAQGFLNQLHDTHEDAVAAGLALAREIAAKSPLVITGIKQVLNAGRDMTIAQGLDYVAVWNAGMLQGEDSSRAIAAQLNKGQASYGDLAP
ncbi:crotonase/enoyl-CoA hydratase family protein [Sandaracinobacteroides sp. A072]|uniref:crotonase/enoyl-CoA hydratase family protein n=1 Tax=Sandaracinobacteroides sp. A072 TaxID=3461146 RepID=UPI004043514C